VALDRLLATSGRDPGGALAKLRHELLQPRLPTAEVVSPLDPALDQRHRLNLKQDGGFGLGAPAARTSETAGRWFLTREAVHVMADRAARGNPLPGLGRSAHSGPGL